MTSFLECNGFPFHFIQDEINKFLGAKYNSPENIDSEEIHEFYFIMSYFGYQSEEMKGELCRQYTETVFSHYQIQYYSSQSSHNRESSFKHKTKLNKGMHSAVAYEYQCPKRVQYIILCSTIRNLSTRAAEHAEVSFRTELH